MKSLVLSMLIVALGFITLQAQPQDNSFQKFYSQVQNVLAKDVESLGPNDLNTLKEAIKLSSDYYGQSNQKLVVKMIQEAKAKKSEYDNYVKTKDDLHKTKQDLDVTTDAWKQAEVRGDSLFSENVQLKVLIEQLNTRINKLDKESKKLQTINKKIQQENMQTKDMLQSSRATISRIMSLLPVSPQRNEMNEQVPSTLQDSLNQSECQVAELLKNNYILTLEGFKRDQMFIDSASNYFRDNMMHLQVIEEYISIGTDLAARLKERGTDCTSNYAAEIESTISDLKSLIESSELSFGAKFSRFISENIGIVIALAVIIIALIAFLLVRKKK